MYKTLWLLADMADRLASDTIMSGRARGEVRDIERNARLYGERLGPLSLEAEGLTRQFLDDLAAVTTGGVLPRDPRTPLTPDRVAIAMALVALALARSPRSSRAYRETAATVAESMLGSLRHWGPTIPWSVVDERIAWYAGLLGERFFPAAPAPAAPANQPAQPAAAPAAPAE